MKSCLSLVLKYSFLILPKTIIIWKEKFVEIIPLKYWKWYKKNVSILHFINAINLYKNIYYFIIHLLDKEDLCFRYSKYFILDLYRQIFV